MGMVNSFYYVCMLCLYVPLPLPNLPSLTKPFKLFAIGWKTPRQKSSFMVLKTLNKNTISRYRMLDKD